MAVTPTAVTKKSTIGWRYFHITGILAMAYMGIKNKITAIIGPDSISIMPNILGFKVPTNQQLAIINKSINPFKYAGLTRRVFFVALANKLYIPSRAPR